MNCQRRTTLILGLVLLFTNVLGAQQNKDWKDEATLYQQQLTPQFFKQIEKDIDRPLTYSVSVKNWEEFLSKINQAGLQNCLVDKYPTIKTVKLKVSAKQILEWLPNWEEVFLIDRARRVPQPERAVRAFDLGVNKINYIHDQYPEWSGQGVNISVKEFSMDSLDIDFADRFISSNNPTQANTHATTMATMIAGAGNSSTIGKGVAWKANLTSTSFLNLFPESDIYYQTYGIGVQNHSYGLGIENFYGAEAAAYDDQIYRDGHIVHIFSAGNIGDSTSIEGPYAGIPDFANLTGTFKMAKNVITVGSLDADLDIQAMSSRGPAYDGRIKPELMALGQEGSSGAAAITSGVAAILQQAYFEQHAEALPNALLRAMLINSADDLHTTGPDFRSGFGNVNAQKAIENIENQSYFNGIISQGETLAFELMVPANVVDLKITLAWTDPAAEVNASQALINDIDCRVMHVASGDNFLPWILNTEASVEQLNQPAVRGTDHLNIQEQISLSVPNEGLYRIEVNGFNIQQGPQSFFIVYEWTTAEVLTCTHPTRSDILTAETSQFIRWSGHTSETINASYKLVDSDVWEDIQMNIDPTLKRLAWNTPDVNGLLQVKLDYGAKTIISDTFAVSAEPDIMLNLDCDDFIQLEWNSIHGVDRYQIYHYIEEQLRPLMIVENKTSIILDNGTETSDYFAVAPFISAERLGKRSNSLFVPFQNAGCYIRNFLVGQENNAAVLELTLGAVEGVATVNFQKFINGNYQTISTIENITSEVLTTTDANLIVGSNLYRATVILENGRAFISGEDELFFIPENKTIIFPNPLPQEEDLLVANQNPVGDIFELYDALGRLVVQSELISVFERVPTRGLAPGLYFYHILREGKRVGDGKVLIE